MTYKKLLMLLQKITLRSKVFYHLFSITYVLVLLYYSKSISDPLKRHFYVL